MAISLAQTAEPSFPKRVPPKRSLQIQSGFGINSDLPREPYLPWDRWWWTRMFDAGVSWIRIGQYENSSDPTSWDWVERKRGEFLAKSVDFDFGNDRGISGHGVSHPPSGCLRQSL